MRKLRLIRTSDILRLQGNNWQDQVLNPQVWDPLLREETSHLPVFSHLSPAPSRSRSPGLDLSHQGLMRILLWPFSTASPQFPLCPGIWSTEPFTHSCVTSAEDWPRLSPQGPPPLLSRRPSDFPAKMAGEHLPILPWTISVLCAILWGKNHCRPQGRVVNTRSPEPALLHSRAFCLKDAPQGQVTTGGPWAPGATWGTLGPALPRDISLGCAGVADTREVRGWTELSMTWPLLLPAVWSQPIYLPSQNHSPQSSPAELTVKPPSLCWREN